MLPAVGLFAVLFGTWIVLSGHFTPFLLISGAICSALTVAITLRMDLLDQRRDTLVPLVAMWRLPFYLLWLAWQIILWSLIVSRMVLAPRIDIDPVLDRIPSGQRSDLAKVIYANSITLTPGTVALTVMEDRIHVHALTQGGFDDLVAGEMNRRVCQMEGTGVGTLAALKFFKHGHLGEER